MPLDGVHHPLARRRRVEAHNLFQRRVDRFGGGRAVHHGPENRPRHHRDRYSSDERVRRCLLAEVDGWPILVTGIDDTVW